MGLRFRLPQCWVAEVLAVAFMPSERPDDSGSDMMCHISKLEEGLPFANDLPKKERRYSLELW